jgi:hypothetical protein
VNEATGDMWTCSGVKVIPTNGVFVTRRGGTTLAVMGAGVARQARDRYPGLVRSFGKLLKTHGNRVHVVDLGGKWDDYSKFLITFPTKHHWRDPSDLRLIETSAEQLVAVVEAYGHSQGRHATCRVRPRPA